MSGEDGKMEVVDGDSSLGATYAFILGEDDRGPWAEVSGTSASPTLIAICEIEVHLLNRADVGVGGSAVERSNPSCALHARVGFGVRNVAGGIGPDHADVGEWRIAQD